MEWQPIETAPKGVKILAGYFNKLGKWRTITARYCTSDYFDEYYGEHEPVDGWYEESETQEVILLTDEPPTHWQSLPEPPKEE